MKAIKRIISSLAAVSMIAGMMVQIGANAASDSTTEVKSFNAAYGKSVVGYRVNDVVVTDCAKITDGNVFSNQYVSMYNAKYFEVDLGSDYLVTDITVYLQYGSTAVNEIKGKASDDADFTSFGSIDYTNSSTVTPYTVSLETPKYCRYIRYCAADTNTQLVVNEIEVNADIEVNTSYESVVSATGTQIISSGTIYGGTDSKAFDKNTSTQLIVYPNRDKNIVLDLGKTYKINRFDMSWSMVSWENSTHWDVYGSPDNSSWTALTYADTLRDATNGSGGTEQLYFEEGEYRYIKLVSSVGSGQFLRAYEIDLYGYEILPKDYLEGNLTQNGITSVNLNVSDSKLDSSYKLYDEDESTEWYSSGFSVKSTTIDLGMKYDITSIYYNFHSSPNISNRTYSVKVSSDNLNYTEVGTVTPSSSDLASTKGTIELSEPKNARYVRFESESSGQVGWNEIKIFGRYKMILGQTGYIIPDNDDADVSTLTKGNTQGKIHFGYNMNPDTLNADNIIITDDNGEAVNLTGKYTASATDFIFDIDALASDTKYTVKILKTVQRSDQTEFEYDYTYTFTTGIIIPVDDNKMIKNVALNKPVTASYTLNNGALINDGNVTNYGYVSGSSDLAEHYITIDLGSWYDVRAIRLYERNLYSTDDNHIWVRASGETTDVSKMDILNTTEININTSSNKSNEYALVINPNTSKKYRYITIYRNDGARYAMCIAEAEVFACVDTAFDDTVFKDTSSAVVNELNWGDICSACVNYDSAVSQSGYTMIVSAYNSFGAMNYYEEFPISVNEGEGIASAEFTVPENAEKVKAIFGRYTADGAFEVLSKGVEASATDAGMTLTDYIKAVMDDSNTDYQNTVLSDAITNKELKVSFVGGSITQGAKDTGWSAKTVRNIETAIHNAGYTDVDVIECNAGVGGTGSNYGTIRLAQDVISQNPDMVVVEFAVNDNTGLAENIVLRNMEGIVKQLQACNKVPMISYVYTSSNIFSSSADVHQKVADYYNIGSVNLGEYLKNQSIYNGVNVNRYFTDSVHPSAEGQELYAQVIWNNINAKPMNFFKQADLKETTLTENPADGTGVKIAYDSSEIKYTGAWTDDGGVYYVSETVGDTAEFTFTGSELLVIAPTGEKFDGDMSIQIKNSKNEIITGTLNTSKRNIEGYSTANVECYMNYDLPEDTYTVTFTNETGKTTGLNTVWYAR